MNNFGGQHWYKIFLLIIHTKLYQCEDLGKESDEEKCIFLTASRQLESLTCGIRKSMKIKQAFYGQYKTDEHSDSGCHFNEENHCRSSIPYNLYDSEDQRFDLPRTTDIVLSGGCTGKKYMYIEYECISGEVIYSLCDEIDDKVQPVIHLKNNLFPDFERAARSSCGCIIEASSQDTIQFYSLTAAEQTKSNNFAIAENEITKYSTWISDMPQLGTFQNGTLFYESEGPIVLITLEHSEPSTRYRYYITVQAKQDGQQLNLTCGNAGEVWRKYMNKINPTTTTTTTTIYTPVTTLPTTATSPTLTGTTITTIENTPTTTKPTTLSSTTQATTKIRTQEPSTTERSFPSLTTFTSNINISATDETTVKLNTIIDNSTKVGKSEDEEMTNNNTGLIAGSITGAFLFILLVVLVAVVIVKYRKKADTDPKSTNEMYETVAPTAVTQDTTQHVYSELDPATVPYLTPQPSYVNTTFTLEPGSNIEYEVINTKAGNVKEQGRIDRGVVNEEVQYEVVSGSKNNRGGNNKVRYENVANGKVDNEENNDYENMIKGKKHGTQSSYENM